MNIEDAEYKDEIRGRLERLERAVFGTRKGKELEKRTKERGAALPDHVLSLRDAGFFESPKTSAEVHARLQAKYRCEPDRVAMALLRLLRRRELRKASKANEGRKQVAYVW